MQAVGTDNELSRPKLGGTPHVILRFAQNDMAEADDVTTTIVDLDRYISSSA